jgi:serine acetyltransferase
MSTPVTTVGRNVIFGAGSCAYGHILIGDGCKIAVNAVVETDIPPESVVFGVPARIVAKSAQGSPSDT